MGTNDHSSTKNAKETASEVMELVDICRRLKIDVIVSEMVSRGDDLNVTPRPEEDNFVNR